MLFSRKIFFILPLILLVYLIVLVNKVEAQNCFWREGFSCAVDPQGYTNYAPDIFCISSPKPPGTQICCCKTPPEQLTQPTTQTKKQDVPEPPSSQIQVQKRCWNKEECRAVNGLWADSKEWQDNYNNGQPDRWSVDYCRSTNEGVKLARCFAKHPSLPVNTAIPGFTKRFCSVYSLGQEPLDCTEGGDEICAKAGKGNCLPGIVGGFPGYLAVFYKFFVAALAVIAVVMVMWGGFKRIMAAGSPEKVKDANDTIMGAISGLVIALLSFSLLQLINPQLVKNILPEIEKVKKEGFAIYCESYEKNKVLYEGGYTRLTGRCVGEGASGIHCLSDKDCEGKGKCEYLNITTSGKPPWNTCGVKLYFNNLKADCLGTECGHSPNTACLSTSDDPKELFCREFFLAGKIERPDNAEVEALRLAPICNNHSTTHDGYCVLKPVGSISNAGQQRTEIDIEDRSLYFISPCYIAKYGGRYEPIDLENFCADKGGFKGYALGIRLSYGTHLWILEDDSWFYLDRSTCDGVSKPINTGEGPYANKINWSSVQANQLFSKDMGQRCNLNINKKEFPDD